MTMCTLASLLAHLWGNTVCSTEIPRSLLCVQSSVHPHLSFHIIYSSIYPPHHPVSQGRGFHISVPSGYPVKKEETPRKRGEVIDIQRFDGLSVSGWPIPHPPTICHRPTTHTLTHRLDRNKHTQIKLWWQFYSRTLEQFTALVEKQYEDQSLLNTKQTLGRSCVCGGSCIF